MCHVCEKTLVRSSEFFYVQTQILTGQVGESSEIQFHVKNVTILSTQGMIIKCQLNFDIVQSPCLFYVQFVVKFILLFFILLKVEVQKKEQNKFDKKLNIKDAQ